MWGGGGGGVGRDADPGAGHLSDRGPILDQKGVQSWGRGGD